MLKRFDTRAAREWRHKRIRRRVEGSSGRPRLSVYRSLSHIYAQIIDDTTGRTVASASSLEPSLRNKLTGNKSEAARAIGSELAQRARAAGITSVVFDRGGFLYHGRVRALAEGARAGGLKF